MSDKDNKFREALDTFVNNFLMDYLSISGIIELGNPVLLSEGADDFSAGLSEIYKAAEEKKGTVMMSGSYEKVKRLFSFGYQQKILKGLNKEGFEDVVKLFWSIKQSMMFDLAEKYLSIKNFRNLSADFAGYELEGIKKEILAGLIAWEVAIHGFQNGGLEF